MIRFENVEKVFHSGSGVDPVVAVAGVSLEVAAGETLCLIGTSGSGKTTLLRMVNRLAEPTRGQVLVAGAPVDAQDKIALRRGIGYVIQRGGLFPHLTVARNVALSCEIAGWPRARTAERVGALLELVNLPPATIRHRFPHELSGGQQQRVGIARALALDPPIMLMDEPFGALDPITRGQLHDEFRDLERTVAKTVLLVTHDLGEAFALGDRIALMDGGRLVQVGTEEDLRQRPASPFVTDFVRGHLRQGPAHG